MFSEVIRKNFAAEDLSPLEYYRCQAIRKFNWKPSVLEFRLGATQGVNSENPEGAELSARCPTWSFTTEYSTLQAESEH